MKITHVRVSELISGPGYNNRSVALEAALEDGDDYAQVALDLRAKCLSTINGSRELDRLFVERDELLEDIRRLERLAGEHRGVIKKAQGVIDTMTRLRDIAKERSIDVTALDDELFDNIPF
jgi:hypothetical protein